jgi:molecular chaperone IbpA
MQFNSLNKGDINMTKSLLTLADRFTPAATPTLTLDSLMKDIEKIFVGSDWLQDHYSKVQNMASHASGYPPYNIRKRDYEYVIEMAVAGFSRDEIKVEVEDNVLRISGAKETKNADYIYQGIAARSFTREFALGQGVQVNNAEIVDGILQVYMMKEVPEEKKPRQIPVL